MCQLSKIDVSTFGDRCVDLEDRWSLCRPSKIDDRCAESADLRRSMCRPSKIDVNYVVTLAPNIDSIVVCELR